MASLPRVRVWGSVSAACVLLFPHKSQEIPTLQNVALPTGPPHSLFPAGTQLSRRPFPSVPSSLKLRLALDSMGRPALPPTPDVSMLLSFHGILGLPTG